MDVHGPKIVFTLPIFGGIGVSQTVTTSWIIMAGIILFFWFSTRKLERVPRGKQIFVEAFVGGINGLVAETMGKKYMGYAPYIGSLFLFALLSNLSGLLGFRPPTADLNTTLAWALVTFSLIHLNGIRSKGFLGWIKGFMDPIPLMLPLNIVGELATPVSLSFRMFGNISGGFVIMGLLYAVLKFAGETLIGMPILAVGIPAFLHIYFDVFAGVLQAFIFIMLTMVFVSSSE